MKKILFLLFVPVFLSATNVSDFGVNPGNDPYINTERLQAAINSAQDGDEFDFRGVYNFSFSLEANFITISKSLTFSGPCSLVFANENPQFESGLFKIVGAGNLCFNKIKFVGPENPGANKENNAHTFAIYGSGDFTINVSDCAVSKNFFTGILATSTGTQVLNINNTSFEVYGDGAVSVFGTQHDKFLNVTNCKFLRAGLAPNETNSGQDFGVHIYCHPNVTVKISGCEFYDNHRNAIQFASGTALYYKKYPATGFHNTRHQIVENCFFDKTCNDGVQFSFYYPNAVVSGCNFQNAGIGVQAENTTTIKDCYFYENSKSIELAGNATVIADKNVALNIVNCNFYASTAISAGNHIMGIKTVVNSHGNIYKCTGNAILVGTRIAADSQATVFNSMNDFFIGNQNACYFMRYNTTANFTNPTVDGQRFIFPDNTSNGANALISGGTYIGQGPALYASNWSSKKFSAYFSGMKMLSPTAEKMVSTPDLYGWRVSFSEGMGDTINSAKTIGAQINTNNNTYFVSGSSVIENIYPFGLNDSSVAYDWRRYIFGSIKLIAKDGFYINQSGNISTGTACAYIEKGKAVTLAWSKILNKWIKQ